MLKKAYMFILVGIVSFCLTACGSEDASATSGNEGVTILSAEEAAEIEDAKDSEEGITVENTVATPEEEAEEVATPDENEDSSSKWNGEYVSVDNFINGDYFDLEAFFKANGAKVKYYKQDENRTIKEVSGESTICIAWLDNGWYITVVSMSAISVSHAGTGSEAYGYDALPINIDLEDKIYANSAGLELTKNLVETLDDVTYLVLTHPDDHDPLESGRHGELYLY